MRIERAGLIPGTGKGTGPLRGLPLSGPYGKFREMDESGEVPGTARKKHRHDLGHEDHGPKVAERTTRGIQILLGLWIALTLCLVVYALVDASRPKDVVETSGSSETTK